MTTTDGRPTDPASATTVVQTMKAAQYLRSPARWVVVAAAMITVSVVGGGIPSVTAIGASSAPPSPDPGSPGVLDELVEVGGARLHLHCSGAGDTTVVLIAGLGDGGDNWGAIEPAVAQSARVCSYAHFGTGTSDPPPRPQTFSSRANDLQALLRVAGEHSPYLLVGHSFGGAEAVMFASMFPADVAGVLLLDASPATWITTLCSVVDDGSDAAASYRELCASLSDPANNPNISTAQPPSPRSPKSPRWVTFR
jgi:pimeloyl-ACP methyl ester carboxylesterase